MNKKEHKTELDNSILCSFLFLTQNIKIIITINRPYVLILFTKFCNIRLAIILDELPIRSSCCVCCDFSSMPVGLFVYFNLCIFLSKKQKSIYTRKIL